MRKFLIAGMKQSGSTAVYNIARQCHILSGNDVYSTNHRRFDETSRAEIQIVKLHDFSPRFSAWADVVITVKRDLRDALASYARRFTKTPREYRGCDKAALLSALKKNKNRHLLWKPRATFEFVYEKYYENPVDAVDEFQVVVGTSADSQQVSDLVDQMRERDYGADLYLDSRRTNQGKPRSFPEVLDEALLAEMDPLIRGWLVAEGYE